MEAELMTIVLLNRVMESFFVVHHLYADDTQRVISCSSVPFPTSIAQLRYVVNKISQWMLSNCFCLNPSKTEFIIIGQPAQIKKLPDPSIHLSNNSSSTTFISDASVWCCLWSSIL